MTVLNRNREFASNYLPEVATISRQSFTPDGLGGQMVSVHQVQESKARVAPIKGTIARDAERIAPSANVVIYVEFSADVKPKDLITVSGKQFRVVEKEFSAASSLFTRLFCVEV